MIWFWNVRHFLWEQSLCWKKANVTRWKWELRNLGTRFFGGKLEKLGVWWKSRKQCVLRVRNRTIIDQFHEVHWRTRSSNKIFLAKIHENHETDWKSEHLKTERKMCKMSVDLGKWSGLRAFLIVEQPVFAKMTFKIFLLDFDRESSR